MNNIHKRYSSYNLMDLRCDNCDKNLTHAGFNDVHFISDTCLCNKCYEKLVAWPVSSALKTAKVIKKKGV